MVWGCYSTPHHPLRHIVHWNRIKRNECALRGFRDLGMPESFFLLPHRNRVSRHLQLRILIAETPQEYEHNIYKAWQDYMKTRLGMDSDSDGEG
jgi:hypothetical protein